MDRMIATADAHFVTPGLCCRPDDVRCIAQHVDDVLFMLVASRIFAALPQRHARDAIEAPSLAV